MKQRERGKGKNEMGAKSTDKVLPPNSNEAIKVKSRWKRKNGEKHSKEFPNFQALTDQERVAFFEALSAARRNVERSGAEARETFGTIHDEYLEYFEGSRGKMADCDDAVSSYSSCSSSTQATYTVSELPDYGEEIAGAAETENVIEDLCSSEMTPAPEVTSFSPNRRLINETVSPAADVQAMAACETILDADQNKMMDIFLRKRRAEEEKNCRGENERSESLYESQVQAGRRKIQAEKKKTEKGVCMPKFEALNPEERQIFFSTLREAHDNVYQRLSKKEIRPFETILKRYEFDDKSTTGTYSTSVTILNDRTKSPKEGKNLRVKLTLTSVDNQRLKETAKKTQKEENMKKLSKISEPKPKENAEIQRQSQDLEERVLKRTDAEHPYHEDQHPEHGEAIQVCDPVSEEKLEKTLEEKSRILSEDTRKSLDEKSKDSYLRESNEKSLATVKSREKKENYEESEGTLNQEAVETKKSSAETVGTKSKLDIAEKTSKTESKGSDGGKKRKKKETTKTKNDAKSKEANDIVLHCDLENGEPESEREEKENYEKTKSAPIENKNKKKSSKSIVSFLERQPPPACLHEEEEDDGIGEVVNSFSTNIEPNLKESSNYMKSESSTLAMKNKSNASDASTKTDASQVKSAQEEFDFNLQNLLSRNEISICSVQTRKAKSLSGEDSGANKIVSSKSQHLVTDVETNNDETETKLRLRSEDLKHSSDSLDSCQRKTGDARLSLTKIRRVRSSLTAPDVYLKFKENVKQGPEKTDAADEENAGIPRSISHSGVAPINIPPKSANIERDPKKNLKEDTSSLIMASPSTDSVSTTSSEDESLLVPMYVKKKRLPTTKIRILQDLLKERAAFVEGSISEFKIVRLPHQEIEPSETPAARLHVEEEEEVREEKSAKSRFFRALAKLCRCGRKEVSQEENMLENLKGEAVAVDVSKGTRNPASITLNESTMEVLKAAERKKIIQKYWKTT